VVRDPRKAAAAKRKVAPVQRQEHGIAPSASERNEGTAPAVRRQPPPLPFEPSGRDRQSVGSTLASYTLAGAGVAMGVSLVGALLGGF